MSNVLVHGVSPDYVALIDWGCARFDDDVADFLAMPIRAVPLLLSGYREGTGSHTDASAEARILWRRIQVILAIMPRGAAVDCSWGERPIAWLVDLLGFFAGRPTGIWSDLAPPQVGA